MATYYPETGTLVDEWCVDDVLEQRPDLNWEQASDVLYTMAHHFDATIGINWDVIDAVAHHLYPDEKR